jgi:O-antigen/teichoic acid export membrane protein
MPMSAADTPSAHPPADTAADGVARMSQLLRYAIGIAAPASVAIAHFAVQLLLLRHLSPGDFGTFALLMVTIQLGYGLSNALIATPYTVALHDTAMPEGWRQSFFSVNALYALAFGLVCGLMGELFSHGAWIPVFALYATLAMMRWFGRAHCYAVFRQLNAAATDLTYSVLLLIFLGLLWLWGRLDLLSVSLALLAATLGSMIAVRSGFIGQQFGRAVLASPRPYGSIWKSQSRWSLLGVVTTEATTNAHAYLVSAFAGPAAFAPLAAAALFLRPVSLAITSLTQLERPSLSRAIARRDVTKARAISRTFLIVLLAIWFVVAALALGLLLVRPDLLAGQHYDPAEIRLAFALLAAVALFQVVMTPASVFLQAAKEFRMLAMASVTASVFSVLLAGGALAVAGPVYSLIGIIAGKAVMTLQVIRRSLKWTPGDA